MFTSKVLVTVLDTDVETTVHNQKVIFNNSNYYDLGFMSMSFTDCKLFLYTDKSVARPSAIAELLVFKMCSSV